MASIKNANFNENTEIFFQGNVFYYTACQLTISFRPTIFVNCVYGIDLSFNNVLPPLFLCNLIFVDSDQSYLISGSTMCEPITAEEHSASCYSRSTIAYDTTRWCLIFPFSRRQPVLYRGQNQMAVNLQTIFWIYFWMKILVICLKLHRGLILRIQLKSQHWFK